MARFVHLHLHSEYSLLDGTCRVTDIPKRAKECGHDAVALTDHGVMYGAVSFYNACVREGIKPIIGCEVYVAPRSRFSKESADAHPYHLVLLCENEIGYRNLIRMVSLSHTEGFYSKPRVDMELLRNHSQGLIALSGCLAGKIPRLLTSGDYQGACDAAMELSSVFGENHFYIELQDHGLSEQKQILPLLYRLSKECGLPVVATNDCHYLRKTDAEAQAVLLCIQTNSRLAEGAPFGFETDEFYYKETSEMAELFRNYDGALDNSVRIAERCCFSFDFSTVHLPKFPLKTGKNAAAFLSELAESGFSKRTAAGSLDFSAHPESEYRERMLYELSVIDQMGYADYFLIVQDYVNYAKKQGIPVGPGRGSGAGSVVAYFLGITDIDPLRFDLLFERFLNPERVSMPDIDVDFCFNRRDEVIRYVSEKYGSDHVSQIVTFNTLAARAAIRDVGRVLGMPYAEIDAVAKAIPRDPDVTVETALKLPELKKMYDTRADVRRLLNLAQAIEGMPRNVSIHAAGVVITERPVSDYVPLSQSNGAVITQYDMDMIASLGLLKFDFLSLRYLTIISDAVNRVRLAETEFDIEKIPLDDPAAYRLIASGNTSGVFQLESAGMRQMLMNLSPTCFEDIVAAIALYRPGPMDSIPVFIENRKNPGKIRYSVPQLSAILKSTYGCVVYQEQVMEIFRALAGYSFGHADVVRRAMAKKKADVMEAERGSFLSGCASNGIPSETAGALFDDLASFANYAFNKSHAAAYAVISYRTAYLKAHYEKEYYATLLTFELGNMPKITQYISECGKDGIRVLPPDINESRIGFHVCGKNIRFGLLALRNVGRSFLSALVQERDAGGPYRSFDDFIDRMADKDLNKRQVEALIKSGAFDNLGIYRSRLIAVFEPMVDQAQSRSRENLTGQINMFHMPGTERPEITYPALPEYGLRELLRQEKEVTGMYFSGHILDRYSEALAALGIESIFAISQTDEDGESLRRDREKVTVAGVVTTVTKKTTKSNEQMAFFTLEDRSSDIECLVFPKIYGTVGARIDVDSVIRVVGNLSLREDEKPKIVVSEISIVPENKETGNRTVAADLRESSDRPGAEMQTKEHDRKQSAREDNAKNASCVVETPENRPLPARIHALYLRLPDLKGPVFRRVENLLAIFEGNVTVRVFDASDRTYHQMPYGFDCTPFTLHELEEILGTGNVVPK